MPSVTFFIGEGAPGLPLTFDGPTARTAVVGPACGSAFLFDDEEMKAAFAVRRGWSAVTGLAVGAAVSFLLLSRGWSRKWTYRAAPTPESAAVVRTSWV